MQTTMMTIDETITFVVIGYAFAIIIAMMKFGLI